MNRPTVMPKQLMPSPSIGSLDAIAQKQKASAVFAARKNLASEVRQVQVVRLAQAVRLEFQGLREHLVHLA